MDPLSDVRDGGIVSCNGGGDFLLVGSYFVLTGHHAGILLGALPPIVHIRTESDKAALRWSVERMMQELRERRPGGYLVAQLFATAVWPWPESGFPFTQRGGSRAIWIECSAGFHCVIAVQVNRPDPTVA